MSTHDDRGVPTSSGIPAIIIACALGVPSAIVVGFAGTIGQGLGGTDSVLTLPKMSLAGACLGAGAGGLIALLCGCHLRRGFLPWVRRSAAEAALLAVRDPDRPSYARLCVRNEAI